MQLENVNLEYNFYIMIFKSHERVALYKCFLPMTT